MGPTPPVPTPPAPTPPSPPVPTPPGPFRLPAHVLGHYLLIADDDPKWAPYHSDYDWQPVLHPYQQKGANVLFLAFLNPATMPALPPAMANLAATRGSSEPGSVPSSTILIPSLGGYAYSLSSAQWPFLLSAAAARAAGEKVAEWKKLGIDGIDLDLEQGIGDDAAASPNLIEFVKAIHAKEPNFIVTLPKDGYPNAKVTNNLINNAWDAQGRNLGLLDRVSVMQYSCQASFGYVKNYADAESQWSGFPIKVNVPMENMMVGIGGKDSASCITTMASSVKSQSLGGMMVWFGSVIDAGKGDMAFAYNAQYDASLVQDSAWEQALGMLGSNYDALV